jgi:hypothetical protein
MNVTTISVSMPKAFNTQPPDLYRTSTISTFLLTAMSNPTQQDGESQHSTDQTLPIHPEIASNDSQDPKPHVPSLGDAATASSHVVLYFMTIHFLLAFAELILVAPLIQLFENSLCIRYYDVHDPGIIGAGGNIPEARCKIPEIQAELAAVRGWKGGFDTIPGRATFFTVANGRR